MLLVPVQRKLNNNCVSSYIHCILEDLCKASCADTSLALPTTGKSSNYISLKLSATISAKAAL